MERYSLIIVSGETSPIRRYDVEKTRVRRALLGGAALAVLLLVGLVDYVRVRIDQVDLESLRRETVEQRARIEAFDATVADVQEQLARIGELERKVRTIANLPGSAAAGGVEVVEVGLEGADPDAGRGGDSDLIPAEGEVVVGPGLAPDAARAPRVSVQQTVAERVSQLRLQARRLGLVADARASSLAELVAQLEDKQTRLSSSPAIWPTRGWLTSRFGPRISPFTGRRQFHSGIDIAGAVGTTVVAPARGKVVFAGRKGPLGRSVVIDHGYGVRTHYGHNSELYVKVGTIVERGEKIAALGSTGRSTGPHLHYGVEVHGKPVNPLDYILD